MRDFAGPEAIHGTTQDRVPTGAGRRFLGSLDEQREFASAIRVLVSLSTVGTPGRRPSHTRGTSVPPPASTSVVVIAISPRSAGSAVSNSTTSNNLLVRHELRETAVVRVGLRGRLAGPGLRVVRERDTERPIK